MFTLTEADKFFCKHPLESRYLEFSENERMAAIQSAARDVAAALQLETLPETVDENLAAAICEQAIFLLLNVQVLTGAVTTGSGSNLSPRAQGLLAAVTASSDAAASGGSCRLVRG